MEFPDIALLCLIAAVCLAVTVRNVFETIETGQSIARKRRIRELVKGSR